MQFTLDTNCWIAIEERREPEATAVRTLCEAHAKGTTHVSVVAISASEKQPRGGYIQNFQRFRARLAALGLAHLDILRPMAYWDITFWESSLWADPKMEALERQIHLILFPNVQFSWEDYCRANGLDPASAPTGRWRNYKCNVQSIWTHIYNKKDVFVTSDEDFHTAAKKQALIGLGANRIVYPCEAVSLLPR